MKRKIMDLILNKMEEQFKAIMSQAQKSMNDLKNDVTGSSGTSDEGVSKASDCKGIASGLKGAIGTEFGDVSGLLTAITSGDPFGLMTILSEKLGINESISHLIMGTFTQKKEETTKGIEMLCTQMKVKPEMVIPFIDFI